MWTIIWTDENGIEHYDRCESKEELQDVIAENDLWSDEDSLVFPPEADEYASSVPWITF